MNINDAFPSKYLKASDLKGAEPVVTIDRVDTEAVGRDKEMKAVLYFRGKEKGIVLNKTNANKIIQLTGTAITEEWRGHKVRLYATETQFGGETVECIRVKAAAPNGNRGPLPVAPPVKPIEPEPADEDFVGDDESVPF